MTKTQTPATTVYTLATRTSGVGFSTVGVVLGSSGVIVAEGGPRPFGDVPSALADARHLARERRLPLVGDAALREALSAQRRVVAELVQTRPEPLQFHREDGGDVRVGISPSGEVIITGRHDGADAAEIASLLPESFVRAAQQLAAAVQEQARIADLLGVGG